MSTTLSLSLNLDYFQVIAFLRYVLECFFKLVRSAFEFMFYVLFICIPEREQKRTRENRMGGAGINPQSVGALENETVIYCFHLAPEGKKGWSTI